MTIFLAFIAMSIFLYGLWQWATSGAGLWRIFQLRRNAQYMTNEELKRAEKEIQKLESNTDRTLGLSFKIIGTVALIVWAFLGITTVLNMFGVDLIGNMTSRAKMYWAQPEVNSKKAVQNRSKMLKDMSSKLRRQ